YAPFVVSPNGDIRNLKTKIDDSRLVQRMQMLASLEQNFVSQNRGEAAADHAKILDKTLALMTSEQMAAFKVDSEPSEVRDRYGRTGFGNGCLMARRLIETGTPFV